MRRTTTTVLFLLLTLGVAAESFNGRLEKANALFQKGDVEGALGAYRDLQTDAPESDVLYYSIGCAEYAQAMQDAEAGASEGALSALNEAKAAFEKIQTSPDREVRERAEYNHANTIAQITKQLATSGKPEETKAALEQSVQAYEDFLREYPDHKDARNNLDHMRYLLKKWLQNPPPPQQQEGNQQESQENQGEGQEQQRQESAENQERQDQQNQEQEAQAQTAEQQEAQPQQEQSAQEKAEPQDQQTVEAILQSLEDTDQRQQMDRNPPGRTAPRREWW